MSTNVKVIVSKCRWDQRVNSYRVYGEWLVDATFPTLEAARIEGEKHKGEGMSVLVRPTYNESDDKGRFFREWRSFDGNDFKECRWEL